MIKRCVVCDETFDSKTNRRDNVTCSVACRSKLARMRKKADEDRKARLLTSDEDRMMRWLSKNIPDAAHKLNKLKAIHGKEAFNLAIDTLKYIVKHPRIRNQN